MTNNRTMLAMPKQYRKAVSLLAKCYQDEDKAIETPETVEVTVRAFLECLSRRGIDFLPAPEDAELVPVVTVQK